jgi:hypothetical protein
MVKSKRYGGGRSLGDNRDTSDYEHAQLRYKDCDEATKRAQKLTLDQRSEIGSSRPTLENILTTLEKWLHVVMDGHA